MIPGSDMEWPCVNLYVTGANIFLNLRINRWTKKKKKIIYEWRCCRGCEHMVVGFTTIRAISTYNHKRCEFESHSGDTTLCDKVCDWFTTGRWFSPGTPASSNNKTDRHNITEMLLKVAINPINHKPTIYEWIVIKSFIKAVIDSQLNKFLFNLDCNRVTLWEVTEPKTAPLKHNFYTYYVL